MTPELRAAAERLRRHGDMEGADVSASPYWCQEYGCLYKLRDSDESLLAAWALTQMYADDDELIDEAWLKSTYPYDGRTKAWTVQVGQVYFERAFRITRSQGVTGDWAYWWQIATVGLDGEPDWKHGYGDRIDTRGQLRRLLAALNCKEAEAGK